MDAIPPPFFTVIIPTYNRAPLLERALNSLAAQTFRDFEAIVVDDGSTDGTEAMVGGFQGSFPLSYIKQANWGGPAKPRNVGMAEAKGVWLAFLDADDWFYPEKLREVRDCATDHDVVYHHLDVHGQDGRKKGLMRAKPLDKADPFKDLVINGNKLLNSGVCLRKSVALSVGGFSEDKALVATEDFDLWIRVAAVTRKFHLIGKPLGAYFTGPDQISAPSPRFLNAQRIIFERHGSTLTPKETLRQGATMSYIKGMHFLTKGDKSLAMTEFANVLRHGSCIFRAKALYRIASLLSSPRNPRPPVAKFTKSSGSLPE